MSKIISYGPLLNGTEVEQVLFHQLLQLRSGFRTPPTCIWGNHGIGKTELVKAFAQEKGCDFRYIAPSQLEEMGDLIGLPAADLSNQTTSFLPPAWVPNQPGPGILLLDDINRADERILRGLMQLFQFGSLISWQLPDQWMIVLTANPDQGDYRVTPMDHAMLTRMSHVTMQFDVKVWAKWAEKNSIDSRGISFVLTYPEIINRPRTTPRSLVQFFTSIQGIPHLKEQIKLVRILAESYLEQETALAFVDFVRLDLDQFISVEAILTTQPFHLIKHQLSELIDQETKRLDILSVVFNRLSNHLLLKKEKLEGAELQNLEAFLLLPFIPNDLRLILLQELTKVNHPIGKQLMKVPKIGRLMLTQM